MQAKAASDFSCSRTTSHKWDDSRFILTSEMWEIRFAVTAQWPEPLWQCKSPKSGEPREEAGLAPLNQRNKTAPVYWGHWDNTNFLNPMKKLKTTHTKCNICCRFCVSFYLVFLFFFWCKAGASLVFSNMGCSFLWGTSLSIYENALFACPSSVLYQKRLGLNTTLRETGKSIVMLEGSLEQYVFSKKKMENILKKVSKGKLKQALICRRQNTLQMWSPSSFYAIISNTSSHGSE